MMVVWTRVSAGPKLVLNLRFGNLYRKIYSRPKKIANRNKIIKNPENIVDNH